MSHSAPYGSWTSPITADVLTTAGLTLSEVGVDGQDLYWLEGRPTESGRVVLVRLREGEVADVTPPPLNVRTRVHEYGGGAYDVRDGVVVYSDFADGRVRVIENQQTRALTPAGEPSVLRFGDLQLDLPRRRVLCVREDHRSPDEVVNELVAVPLDGEPSEGKVLVTGPDFVAAPRLSPDGPRSNASAPSCCVGASRRVPPRRSLRRRGRPSRRRPRCRNPSTRSRWVRPSSRPSPACRPPCCRRPRRTWSARTTVSPGMAGGAAASVGGSALFMPQPNWYYRALKPHDPTAAQILRGASLLPRAPNPGFTFQPELNPAKMTFRHLRPAGNVLTKGTDRISTAADLEAFRTILRERGTGELVRVDPEAARRLGAQFLESGDIMAHLDEIGAQITRELEAARLANRGVNAITHLEDRLRALEAARSYARRFAEGEGVGSIPGSIPGRAVTRVPGRTLLAAVAGEEALTTGMRAFRFGGRVLIVVGVGMSAHGSARHHPDRGCGSRPRRPAAGPSPFPRPRSAPRPVPRREPR